MNNGMRIFVGLPLTLILLTPVARSQKAPPPPPPAPSPSPVHASPPISPNSQPLGAEGDRILFLVGRVATNDGTTVPNDAKVERICRDRIRQQVYASLQGDFNMQVGSMVDSYLDASGDQTSRDLGASGPSQDGIPRRELANCELRASAPGFRSTVINLVDLTPFGNRLDVGSIVVERMTKIKGATLDATPYKAPKDARKAYEKGVEAEKKGELAAAHRYFERAVELYPKYTSAWFQLGTVLEKENQNDRARTAFLQATTIDFKFLPPYLSLAVMAYKSQNWPDVLKLTSHILDLDPANKTNIAGYILELDPSTSAQAYFYNAFANFKLSNFEASEKSARKAEQQVTVRTQFPLLHLLLADLFARRNNFAGAVSELRIYLEMAPQAKDADQVREQLAKWQKSASTVPAADGPVKN